jgi:hypothetical protein
MLLFLPTAASCLDLSGVTLAGNNRLEYWLWRETKEEVFDDKLDIDAFYKSFLLGFRYHVVEPSNTSIHERREGFYRRYIEYDSERFGIRAGNYYVMFGSGLVLRAYEDDVAYLDSDIDGVKLRGSTSWLDVVAISGRPRITEFPQLTYGVVNDTTDVLRGGDVMLHPFSFARAGASYVLLTSKDLFDPSTFKRTEVYGTNVSCSVRNFDIYGELAKKHGWDPMLFAEDKGYGIYGSASVSFPGYGASFQFADYDSIGLGNFNYRYNSPPILNRYGQSINRGLDETGYQMESYISPVEPLNINVSYSNLKTADDTLSFKEAFAEVLYRRSGLFETRLGFDRTDQHGIVGGVPVWKEDIPRFDGTFYVTPTQTVGLGLQQRSISGSKDFQDRRVNLSYSFVPHVTLTLTGERRNKEQVDEPGKEWRSGQIDWDITQDHRLTLIVGSEKGGLVCSGGVCRYEAPFDGLKAVLTSRF